MCLLALAAAAALTQAPPVAADLQGRISARQDAAQSLRAEVAAESRRIAATSDGVAQAQRRLAAIDDRLQARETQQKAVQQKLVQARARLLRLENRMRVATRALATQLVASYKGDRPDLIGVVMSAHGFADLLDGLEFLKRVGQQDARILDAARTTHAQVGREARSLTALDARERRLVKEIAAQHRQAQAIATALVDEQTRQLRRRAHTAAQLRGVRAELGRLQARRARIAREAAAAARAAAPGISVNSGGMAQPPAGAPAAVAQVMAAGNAIAGLPYLYGGGHGSFQANAYDCSGSVSYALAAAGLVTSPLDSTAFESWGEPGPGRWITVYANAGHAYMVVAGWRFDTVALAADGTRWTRVPRSSAGFVARHPAGL
jgi:cell wall-associated NlpC family hydrolase